ncbi:MAG: hypothetical protein ACI8QS_001299 [Planctomycetota bacterium]|jgi:hypothetical protein
MSDKEQRTEDESKEPAAEKVEGKGPKDPKKKPGMDYVFKIAPADPKNAFNFEDVADK